MIDNRKNSFEFYGYDFMVSDDLRVWLIEVNSSPSMECKGQPILKELVNNVLTDLAKVIVDIPITKSADTGQFKLIHRGKNEVKRPKQLGGRELDLTVQGKKHGTKMKIK